MGAVCSGGALELSVSGKTGADVESWSVARGVFAGCCVRPRERAGEDMRIVSALASWSVGLSSPVPDAVAWGCALGEGLGCVD